MKNKLTKVMASILMVVVPILPGSARPGAADAGCKSSQVRLMANWLLSHRDSETGLPRSHVGDERFRDWCFTYDAAVSALALIAIDRSADARRILDFYISTPHTHRLGGIIEAVSVIPPCDGKDWSVRTGANLWLGLSAYHLFKTTSDPRYLAFATQLADVALGLQDRGDAHPAGGGIRLGPPGDPAIPRDQHFGFDPRLAGFDQVISTEATIDAFALFDLLQAEPGMQRFRIGRESCLVWLRQVAWNSQEKRFNRGFGKTVDTVVASDVHAWGISALGVNRLDTIETGAAESMIRFVERHCRSMVDYRRPDGSVVKVRGFDFVDHQALVGLKRAPLVSPEWTFQMANAYKRLADDFMAMGDRSKADTYAQEREALLGQMMAMASIHDDAAGFPYATLGDAPIGHEYRTPVEGNMSVIGVAYGILACTGYDPLRSPVER